MAMSLEGAIVKFSRIRTIPTASYAYWRKGGVSRTDEADAHERFEILGPERVAARAMAPAANR
jgi:hypothetical protein